MITAEIYYRLKRRKSIELIKHMNETQFYSYEKIRKYQLKKIVKLLNHAYENVPYYNNKFKEIGLTPQDIKSFEDFEKLPILTKDIVKSNFERLIANNINKDNLIPNSTGGSTGKPLHFYQDKQYVQWANVARVRGWYNIAGCDYGNTCAVLWGAMHEVKEDFTLSERLKDYLLHGQVWLNAFNLSKERKYKFIKLCRLARPKLLRGYFTAVKDFASFIDKEGLYFPPIKGIILGAEAVDHASQVFIERVFKAPSYNTYGGRELSLIAMECDHKNGLHEVSENNYVEFENIHLEGYQNAGNLIITNLNNYAMPFIRYRIGDIGIKSDLEFCSCGRGLPLIKKIIGRTTEVLTFYDGTKIAGEMFIHLMKDFPISDYQFVQKSASHVVLKHNRLDKLNQKLKNKIQNTYKSYLPEEVKFEFQEVDLIEKTNTGKFRFVLKEFNLGS